MIKAEEALRLARETFGDAAKLENREDVDRPFLYVPGDVRSEEDWNALVSFHATLDERGLSRCVYAVLRNPEEERQ